MAQFHFKLQAVLRQREIVEEQRQRDLVEANGVLTAIHSQLRKLDEEVGRANNDLRDNRLVGRIDLSYIAAHRRFVLAMQRKGLAQMELLRDAQQKVDIARAALAEAAKQKKIIEKLREKQEAQWKAHLQQKEMADLDEVAMKFFAPESR